MPSRKVVNRKDRHRTYPYEKYKIISQSDLLSLFALCDKRSVISDVQSYFQAIRPMQLNRGRVTALDCTPSSFNRLFTVHFLKHHTILFRITLFI